MTDFTSNCCTETYSDGYKDGREDVKERLIKWIEEHRTRTELDAGIYINRDNFDSEDLLQLINKGL